MTERIDLGYLLQKAAKQYRTRFATELRPLDLTTQQAAVLMAVASSPDRALPPSSIAEAIGADLATTTGLLKRLERDCWLASASNPEDGRSRLVTPTDAAERVVPSIMTIAEGVSARAGDVLSAEELDTLISLLRRLLDPAVAAAGKARS